MTLDRHNLEKLFYRYSLRLEQYAWRFLLDSKLAQDTVQDVFVKLWEKYQGCDKEKWAPLLFTITRNICIDYLKHLKFKRTVIAEDINISEEEEHLFIRDFYESAPTDHTTIWEELNREIIRITNGLAPRCREVFLLSRIEGLKNKEIAERLSISEKTVEKHISAALKAFRKSNVK